jgi:hypothetical protein
MVDVVTGTNWRDAEAGQPDIYLKEVDVDESTMRFWQEIYNEHGELVERHVKYPVDSGHERVGE